MQPQTQFLEIYRAGLKTLNGVMKTSLENAERVQSQQLQFVKRALEENTRSASQLAEIKTLDELMAVQTRLAGSAMDFWSNVWRSASDTQIGLISHLQAQMGETLSRQANTAIREAGVQHERRPQEAQQHRKSA